MTRSKRLFDICLSILMLILLLPMLIGIGVLVLLLDGVPIFYFNERMQTRSRAFQLIKFRTMHSVAQDSGVSGGDKKSRITWLGKFLRQARLDETPQLWNILKGDMSFVGPRPPLRQYVEMFPELYECVLLARPGVTGYASLKFHKHEEWLLNKCLTTEETNNVYARICVPRKAKLDLMYHRHKSLCFDVLILWRTVFSLFSARQ